jgi:hypothetical protein
VQQRSTRAGVRGHRVHCCCIYCKTVLLHGIRAIYISGIGRPRARCPPRAAPRAQSCDTECLLRQHIAENQRSKCSAQDGSLCLPLVGHFAGLRHYAQTAPDTSPTGSRAYPGHYGTRHSPRVSGAACETTALASRTPSIMYSCSRRTMEKRQSNMVRTDITSNQIIFPTLLRLYRTWGWV